MCNKIKKNLKCEYYKNCCKKIGLKPRLKNDIKCNKRCCHLNYPKKTFRTELVSIKETKSAFLKVVNDYFTKIGRGVADSMLLQINKTDHGFELNVKRDGPS